MDVFLDTPTITEAHIPILQEVQLHLQADLLSDIVDASGSRITHASWTHIPAVCVPTGSPHGHPHPISLKSGKGHSALHS
jgi:hypothetical protein